MPPQTTEQKLAQLYPEQRELYDDLAEKIAKVKERHPEFNDKALAALDKKLEFQLDYSLEFNKRIGAVITDPGTNTPKKMDEKMRSEGEKFVEDMANKQLADAIKPYGTDGVRALGFLKQETHAGPVGSITKNFWDGGPQWGGIIGGVIGLAVGMFTGGGTSTWMGILALIAGAYLGGWLGKKTGDAVSSMVKSKSTETAKGTGQSREVSGDGAEKTEAQKAQEAAQRTAREGNQTTPAVQGGDHFSDGVSGNLVPGMSGPPAPKTQVVPAQGSNIVGPLFGQPPSGTGR